MKVSVYLVTFNRKKLLERAILSVVNQTYQNIELIVIDDNSQDGTKEYLESNYDEYNKSIDFKFYVNSKNRGACFSRNKAIKVASGEFITGLDDDDYFLPNRITKFVDAWSGKRLNTICLFSDFMTKSHNGFTKSRRKRTVSQSDLLYSNHIGNQVFTHTKNLIVIKGFDERMKAWQDLDCWYRLLGEGEAERIKDITYVMDVSHAYERISLSRIEKIIESSNHMKKKYGYNWSDRNRLNNQLIRYKFNIYLYLKCLIGFIIMLDRKGFVKLHFCSWHALRKRYIDRY